MVDCAHAATKRHQPFQASVRAWEITGLIGNATGVLYQFRITAGCSDGTCPVRFSLARCPSPAVDRGAINCYVEANRADALQKPEEYLDLVAGSRPVDCGRLGIRATDADLRRALDCALEASRRHDAFQVVKQDQGIDSSIFQGLVGDRAGTIFLFNYDSGPCGSPECFGSFSLAKCPGPTTTMRGNRLHFSCPQ